MINFSTPLEGMRQAENRLNQTANKLATMPSAGSSPPAADQVDLSAGMVSLMQSRNSFATNVNVVHVGDEMTKATLDLLA